MKIIISLLAAMVGLGFVGIVAAICEADAFEAKNYDSDEEGGFLDDWRWP